MKKIFLIALLLISITGFSQKEETVTYGDSVYRVRYTTTYQLDSAIRYNYSQHRQGDTLLVRDSTPYMFVFRRITGVVKDSVLVPTKLKTIMSTPIVGTGDISMSNYSLSNHTHTYSSLTGLPALFTQASADALYSAIGHAHTFASITSKPTTISGYGITDAMTDTSRNNVYAAIQGRQVAGNYVAQSTTVNGQALSGNVTVTTITGNAGTATALQTARAINGTNFDGTAAITITANPTVLAQINATAQAANIATATLYAVPSTGFYRVSIYITVTQAATTSSTMPSTTITYTDGNAGTNSHSTVTTATSAGNSVTTTFAQTVYVCYAKTGTNIQYATGGYASSGATVMQYALRIRVEAL